MDNRSDNQERSPRPLRTAAISLCVVLFVALSGYVGAYLYLGSIVPAASGWPKEWRVRHFHTESEYDAFRPCGRVEAVMTRTVIVHSCDETKVVHTFSP